MERMGELGKGTQLLGVHRNAGLAKTRGEHVVGRLPGAPLIFVPCCIDVGLRLRPSKHSVGSAEARPIELPVRDSQTASRVDLVGSIPAKKHVRDDEFFGNGRDGPKDGGLATQRPMDAYVCRESFDRPIQFPLRRGAVKTLRQYGHDDRRLLGIHPKDGKRAAGAVVHLRREPHDPLPRLLKYCAEMELCLTQFYSRDPQHLCRRAMGSIGREAGRRANTYHVPVPVCCGDGHSARRVYFDGSHSGSMDLDSPELLPPLDQPAFHVRDPRSRDRFLAHVVGLLVRPGEVQSRGPRPVSVRGGVGHMLVLVDGNAVVSKVLDTGLPHQSGIVAFPLHAICVDDDYTLCTVFSGSNGAALSSRASANDHHVGSVEHGSLASVGSRSHAPEKRDEKNDERHEEDARDPSSPDGADG